jgi:DNA-binding MarR family transcriptional regulator
MTHAAVTDRVQKALTSADLPPVSWFELLQAVKTSANGYPRMSELAEWLTLSRGGITKLVDRLERAGYLERVNYTGDRRALQARLTPAGEEMLAEMLVVYETELAHHLRKLSAAEAELITAALTRVTASTCESETVASCG